MPMDIDAVFAQTALDNLKDLVDDLPHGKRSEVADDILAFELAMCKKYNFKSEFTNSNESRLERINREIGEIKNLIEQLSIIVAKEEREL